VKRGFLFALSVHIVIQFQVEKGIWLLQVLCMTVREIKYLAINFVEYIAKHRQISGTEHVTFVTEVGDGN